MYRPLTLISLSALISCRHYALGKVVTILSTHAMYKPFTLISLSELISYCHHALGKVVTIIIVHTRYVQTVDLDISVSIDKLLSLCPR